MPKNAPSLPRIFTMVAFALSCFAILLFLWVSFGGSVPLRPEGYRFQVSFPEAATLSNEADVRISGVNVGKVKKKQLDKGAVRTLVELEVEERFAPIPVDTRAMLRQKTLLGETYVELTPGSRDAPKLKEGTRLAASSVEPTVELDEILRIFDPATKQAFRTYVREQAAAIRGGTSEDFNDALGTLPDFAASGSDTLRILDEQKVALRQFIKNTGVVFAALNERNGELRELIENSNDVFAATASEKEALAETFRIFPTFLDESRFTVNRLRRFSNDTRPLVNALKPVADDIGPTVRDLGNLSPDLQGLFRDLDPLIRAARVGLPDAARLLRGAQPVVEGLHRFLPEFNPILSFLNYYQSTVSDFLMVGSMAFPKLRRSASDPAPIHVLPQFGILGGRSIIFNQARRPVYDRGNAYLAPDANITAQRLGVIPSFDCKPSGVRADPEDPGRPGDNAGEAPAQPPCAVQRPLEWDGKLFPRIRGLLDPLGGSPRTPKPSAPPLATRTDHDRGRVPVR